MNMQSNSCFEFGAFCHFVVESHLMSLSALCWQNHQCVPYCHHRVWGLFSM